MKRPSTKKMGRRTREVTTKCAVWLSLMCFLVICPGMTDGQMQIPSISGACVDATHRPSCSSECERLVIARITEEQKLSDPFLKATLTITRLSVPRTMFLQEFHRDFCSTCGKAWNLLWTTCPPLLFSAESLKQHCRADPCKQAVDSVISKCDDDTSIYTNYTLFSNSISEACKDEFVDCMVASDSLSAKCTTFGMEIYRFCPFQCDHQLENTLEKCNIASGGFVNVEEGAIQIPPPIDASVSVNTSFAIATFALDLHKQYCHDCVKVYAKEWYDKCSADSDVTWWSGQVSAPAEGTAAYDAYLSAVRLVCSDECLAIEAEMRRHCSQERLYESYGNKFASNILKFCESVSESVLVGMLSHGKRSGNDNASFASNLQPPSGILVALITSSFILAHRH